MAGNKTKPTRASVKSFIDALPDQTKRSDAKSLVELMERVTGEKAKMYGPSIIGFGTHHYKYESGREGDMPIACFSPRKAAIVVYQVTKLDASDALLAKLGKHTVGGGCLYIKKLSDVNETVLEALISESVAAIRARYPK